LKSCNKFSVEDALTFTECILKSVVLVLQTFFDTLYTAFDKRLLWRNWNTKAFKTQWH